jgi:hypothetical protein
MSFRGEAVGIQTLITPYILYKKSIFYLSQGMRPYAGSTNVLRAQYIGYKGTNILLDRTFRARCALKNIDAAHHDFELVALPDFYLIDLFSNIAVVILRSVAT